MKDKHFSLVAIMNVQLLCYFPFIYFVVVFFTDLLKILIVFAQEMDFLTGLPPPIVAAGMRLYFQHIR